MARDPDGPAPLSSRGPTIKDVAARAGVSIGTVSHVLTGRRPVTAKRRSRVDRAIEELGYRPNRIARSLKVRQTNTIAMIVPDVANPFFGELMRGAEDEARRRGFCVLFGNTDNDASAQGRYLAEFIDRRVDGLLVIGAADDGSGGARIPASIPMVALDRVPEGWMHDAVVVDNSHGIGLIVEHLAELGHTRIAFVGGDPTESTGRERQRGLDAALSRHRLEPVWLSEGPFTLESGREQAGRLFRQPLHAWPTAIIAGNDLIALGVLAAARDAGVDVPRDVSVVGFDDIAYAALAVPALTSVRQPARDIGQQAARLLLERVAGRLHPPQTVSVRTTLMVRGSSGPARSA